MWNGHGAKSYVSQCKNGIYLFRWRQIKKEEMKTWIKKATSNLPIQVQMKWRRNWNIENEKRAKHNEIKKNENM